MYKKQKHFLHFSVGNMFNLHKATEKIKNKYIWKKKLMFFTNNKLQFSILLSVKDN